MNTLLAPKVYFTQGEHSNLQVVPMAELAEHPQFATSVGTLALWRETFDPGLSEPHWGVWAGFDCATETYEKRGRLEEGPDGLYAVQLMPPSRHQVPITLNKK